MHIQRRIFCVDLLFENRPVLLASRRSGLESRAFGSQMSRTFRLSDIREHFEIGVGRCAGLRNVIVRGMVLALRYHG